MVKYDTIIKNGKIVFPKRGIIKGSIGISDGKIAAIARDLSPFNADRVFDADGNVVFPGVVDSHFHIGIYRPVREDAYSESKAAVTGGVTTIISYFRTGRHYLNTGNPYSEVYPRLLKLSEGAFITDYGYHLALITRKHVDEADLLLKDYGVSTFKHYMFYKSTGIRGAFVRELEREYLLSEDPYDLGHLLLLMKRVADLNTKFGGVRLSVHCEDPEIIRVATEEAKVGKDKALEAYSGARPELAEKFAIIQTMYLAKETGCPINLLHLSGKGALEAVADMKRGCPEIDSVLETTVHHLALTTDIRAGVLGKVNPPIRRREDVEALWSAIDHNVIHTVVSDHAAITKAEKGDDIWTALIGFGGTTLLLPVLLSEGYHKRGLSLQKIADLICYNPAKIHGLYPKKGDVKLGADADLVIVDLKKTQKIVPKILNSAQDFTPFRDMVIKGWPIATFVRGEVVFDHGEVIGKRGYGEYVKRPVTMFED
jgi:dihydropyrimidinase/allantoinase